MTSLSIFLMTLLLVGICLGGLAQSRAETQRAPIITVLPKDAIPAILEPTFVPASQAQVAADAAMIGVVIQQDAHAYAAWLLNAHEIVNDVVGGEVIATTW